MAVPKLLTACKQGDLKKVRHAMKDGMDMQIKSIQHLAISATNDGTSPLLFACKKGHFDLVQNLVDIGADVNQPDDYGDSALMNAILSRNKYLVIFLLSQGANLYHQNEYGETCLHFAVTTGNVDIVLILLEAGLSDWVNMQDIMCNTALFKSTNEDMLQLLESYGADVNIRNRTGARARQNRLFSNNEKAMEVFIRFGLDISDLKSNALVQKILLTKSTSEEKL